MAAMDQSPEVNLAGPQQDQASGAGSHQEPNRQVLPSESSNWNANDAEQLGIFYEHRCYTHILGQVVKKFEKGQHFDELVQSFESLMDEIFSLTEHEQERLVVVLTRKPASTTSEEITFLRELMGRAETNAFMLLYNDDLIKVLVKKTGIREEALRLHCIPNIIEYLTQFQLMLRETTEGRRPNETTFQSLFISFAKIFAVPFRYGSIRQARSMNVCGQEVTCEPDLRYEQYTSCRDEGNVVCVTQVNKSTETTHSQAAEDQDSDTPGTAKRRRLDDDKHSLPDHLKGPHAAELLLELPNSILNISGNKRRMLGLIVEATKIRLTCLEMTTEHFTQIRRGQFESLQGSDMMAHVYYSSPLDMFNKDDRKELVYVMLALGAIGQPENRKGLPIALLEQYLTL